MPLPTSYTEESLAEFMYRSIDNFSALFGWTDTTAAPYPDAVNDVLRGGGLDDLSQAADLRLLEAASRVSIWHAVVRRCSTEYDYTSDGQAFYRSQMYKQAAAELALAEAKLLDAEAAAGVGGASGGGTIGVGRFVWVDDPYTPVYRLGYPWYPAYPIPKLTGS